jgi:hypothetical protein
MTSRLKPSAKKPKYAADDPLLSDRELPLHGLFYPLGFALEITTNSDQVMEAAQESWGHFRAAMTEPPVHLRVVVVEGGQKASPPEPKLRAQQNLVVRVADTENFSISNMAEGFASCWLTAGLVANRGYLRFHFLEGMGWDLLEPRYLTSIHAACVRYGNKGVLLCGESGAGKSSLAYACARRGWAFLSDDSTSLIRKGNHRVVLGNPFQVRFRDSAVELFPELRDRKITRRVNGKLSIEVLTASISGMKTVSQSTADYIVFLKRGKPGAPRLIPFPKETALRWFEQVIFFGDKALREAQKATLRNLLRTEMFELHYDDLDSAVATLEAMVDRRAVISVNSAAAPNEPTHA